MNRARAWLILTAIACLACAGPVRRDAATLPVPADAARVSLEALVVHILERPERAERLFVEGYYMRTLVAAHTVLAGSPDSVRLRAGLEAAIAFADTLVATQREDGYWAIGYDSGWVADMAAALGVFPALEPHIGPQRRDRYVRTAQRFAAALERDALVLENGAIGVGWPMGQKPEKVIRAWRSDMGWADAEYLVSSALAGVGVHAWLYHNTRDARYGARARAALDFTLSKLRSDGSLPAFSPHEGELGASAYVQEGWMAADLWLEDANLRTRLCARLPAHVGWLLRSQRADGTWDSGVSGDSARTPAIVNFLQWYAARCDAPSEVGAAVARAERALTRDGTFPGACAGGEHDEVLRAVSGRALASLVQGAFVP